MFFKIGFLKSFSILTGKHLFGVSLIKLQAHVLKALQLTSFPVNIAKALRTVYFIDHLQRLLLKLDLH